MTDYETERVDMSLHPVVVAGDVERLIAHGFEFVGQVGRQAFWRREKKDIRVEDDPRMKQ